MATLEEIISLAGSSETKDLRRDLSQLPFFERIQTVNHLPQELRGALSHPVGLAPFEHMSNLFEYNHAAKDLHPECLPYLRALEVPYYNLYNQRFRTGRREKGSPPGILILDALIEVALHNNWRPQDSIPSDVLHECVAYVASKTPGLDNESFIGKNAMDNAIITGDLKIVEILHNAGVNLNHPSNIAAWIERARRYDETSLTENFLPGFIALMNKLSLQTTCETKQKPRLNL